MDFLAEPTKRSCPTTRPIEDNLVFENKKDHLWHMDFNDVNSKLTISKKLQYMEPILTVSMLQEFRKNLP